MAGKEIYHPWALNLPHDVQRATVQPLTGTEDRGQKWSQGR